VPKKAAYAVEALLDQLDKSDTESIPAGEIFPHLNNPAKTPGIALRGVHLRLDLTQKEMAEKIGVSQGDLSKMKKVRALLEKSWRCVSAKHWESIIGDFFNARSSGHLPNSAYVADSGDK
jgi:hypothetical protein